MVYAKHFGQVCLGENYFYISLELSCLYNKNNIQ